MSDAAFAQFVDDLSTVKWEQGFACVDCSCQWRCVHPVDESKQPGPSPLAPCSGDLTYTGRVEWQPIWIADHMKIAVVLTVPNPNHVKRHFIVQELHYSPGYLAFDDLALEFLSVGKTFGGKVIGMAEISERDQREIDRANEANVTPVVFIHGLWLLSNSWDRWRQLFEQEAGFVTLAPGWPDDPESVSEANAHPEAFNDKRVTQVADYFEQVVGALEVKPAIVGHSFGGLMTQMLAGRGIAAASVAIDPVPFRGVFHLPLSALKSASPVLGHLGNRHKSVPLTYEQFRFAFANAVTETEAHELYEQYAVPAPGAPIFQAASANFNPKTEVKVDTKNPDRGPLLIISGEKDNTIPWSLAHGAYKAQKKNVDVTEIKEIPNRGHSLTIDNGWRRVAEAALDFIQRFVKPS